jgi:cold shock CspA family protein
VSLQKKKSQKNLSGLVQSIFFDSSKGFGFIKDAKTKESIFVHINNVQADSLKEGNLVTFETEMGNKGPVAINVKLSK